MGFRQFDLNKAVLKGIERAGYKTPTLIQREVIPVILEGRDVIGQARTGSGKTAGFGIPLLSKLKKGEQILVLTPTRELAKQVEGELFKLGKFKGIRGITIYGGVPYHAQLRGIENRQVVVATPGRLKDILTRYRPKFNPTYVVLDEADEMLGMGFLSEIEEILHFLSNRKQTLLFSATLNREVLKLAKKFLTKPVEIEAVEEAPPITEKAILTSHHKRLETLLYLLEQKKPEKGIIFCQRKRDVEELYRELEAQGVSVERIHGDLSQRQRERVMEKFRKGRVQFLVATDVASRGIDIQGVSHIFNYHLPENRANYIHRIGRTGRAGSAGVAVSLVSRRELARLKSWKRPLTPIFRP